MDANHDDLKSRLQPVSINSAMLFERVVYGDRNTLRLAFFNDKNDMTLAVQRNGIDRDVVP